MAGLVELNKVFPTAEFTWQKFFKNNAIALAINFVVGIIFVLAKDEVSVIQPTSKLFFAFIGFTGQTVFLSMTDTFSKQAKTAIGLNTKP